MFLTKSYRYLLINPYSFISVVPIAIVECLSYGDRAFICLLYE